MSKTSLDIIGGRIGGLKTETHHMSYRPGYTKPDGTDVQPRIRFSVFCNELRDSGQQRPDTITVWTSLPWLVWLLTKGKEVSLMNLRRRSYMTRTYDNAGNVLKNPDGTDVMVKRYEFVVRDVVNDIHLGADSAKFAEALAQHAAQEVAAGKRPADWDNFGSAGNTEWRIIEWMRNHKPYEGGETFGYAKVEPIPDGCTLKLQPVPADLRQQAINAINRNSGGNAAPTVITGNGAATGAPAAPPVTGPSTVSNAFNNTVQVEGFTREQYLASGWTDDQLRADAKFAAFFSAPADPAAPGVPAPPAQDVGTTVVTGV
jgi:hypothetical protein